MDWKDLDIADIPSDFFVNENYEVKLNMGIDASLKVWGEPFKSKDTVFAIVKALHLGISEYRYRLKPLESIRITRELSSFLTSFTSEELEEKGVDLSKFENTCSFVHKFDGRKVEVID